MRAAIATTRATIAITYHAHTVQTTLSSQNDTLTYISHSTTAHLATHTDTYTTQRDTHIQVAAQQHKQAAVDWEQQTYTTRAQMTRRARMAHVLVTQTRFYTNFEIVLCAVWAPVISNGDRAPVTMHCEQSGAEE